jgi:uncharacterized protein (DUF58 family)
MKATRVVVPPPRGRLLARRLAKKPARARLPRPERAPRPDDLRSFKNLFFAARTIVEGAYAGKHRSPQKGASPEFVEYKTYVHGDPLAAIDWRAFARTDRHYVRVTQRETDMDCHLLLDGSMSMAYRGIDPLPSSPSKYDYAARLAAALTYVIVTQGDKVSLTLFDDAIRTHVRTGGTLRHVRAVLSQIDRHIPQRATELAGILPKASGLFPRRGVLLVLSDFYDDVPTLFQSLSMFLHRRFEVILFHVLHPDEYRLPRVPHARFVDMESRESLTCAPEDLRAVYDAGMARHLDAMRAAARARGVDYNFVTTDIPYAQALRRYLLRRNAARP